jgi:hypothetical protein
VHVPGNYFHVLAPERNHGFSSKTENDLAFPRRHKVFINYISIDI